VLGFIIPSDDVVAIYSMENAGDFIAIFTAGIISCFLLAVPGISGAMILILLGQMGTVYGAVDSFADMIIMLIRGQDGALELGLASGAIVLTFFAGAIIGLIAAAKIIGYLIERFEVKVYFVVMGLVLGAIVTLFNFGVADQFAIISQEIILNIVFLLVFAAAGYICTKFMGRR
jgi:putative membrane protein